MRFEVQLKGYQGQLEESQGQQKGSEGKPEGSEGLPEGSEGLPGGPGGMDGRAYGQTYVRNFSPFYRTLAPVRATGEKMKKMAKLNLVLFGIFCCFEGLRRAHETSDAPPKECD